MTKPNQMNPYKKRISQNTCFNEDLPYKERPSFQMMSIKLGWITIYKESSIYKLYIIAYLQLV